VDPAGLTHAAPYGQTKPAPPMRFTMRFGWPTAGQLPIGGGSGTLFNP
jgi:hypothetical protein